MVKQQEKFDITWRALIFGIILSGFFSLFAGQTYGMMFFIFYILLLIMNECEKMDKRIVKLENQLKKRGK